MTLTDPDLISRDPRIGSHRIERIVYSEQVIRERVAELGREIADSFDPGDDLLLIGMLKGAVPFMADLARAIPRPVSLDYMIAASYGAGTVSSGKVTLKYDPETSLRGRSVVIVEDIIDSGTTLNQLLPMLEAREPEHLEVCALLHKRLVELNHEARWVGFDAPSDFLVGYGLDYSERFRNLPWIGVLSTEQAG